MPTYLVQLSDVVGPGREDSCWHSEHVEARSPAHAVAIGEQMAASHAIEPGRVTVRAWDRAVIGGPPAAESTIEVFPR